MSIKKEKKRERSVLPKELKYKIYIFKIKDHRTWRALIGDENMKQVKHVTEKKVIEINRLTGEIKGLTNNDGFIY